MLDTVSEPWLLLPLLSMYRPELVNAKYNYQVASQAFFDYLKKKDLSENLRNAIKEVILDLYRVSGESKYFIDKTPRYYEILFDIVDLLPGARFLVLKRNPFAVLHSMINTWSGGKLDFSSLKGYCRDFLVAPFRIQDFCDRYEKSENVLELKYEYIVSNPHTTVKAAYDWLGIPFAEEVLQVGSNSKVQGIFGDDVYRKHPLRTIVPDNAEAWKNGVEADRKLLSFFCGYHDFLTHDFLIRYGYPETNFKRPGLLGGGRFGKFIKQVADNIE